MGYSKVNQRSGIYAIINTIYNKLYIGQAVNFKKRYKEHLRNHRENKEFSLWKNSHTRIQR